MILNEKYTLSNGVENPEARSRHMDDSRQADR